MKLTDRPVALKLTALATLCVVMGYVLATGKAASSLFNLAMTAGTVGAAFSLAFFGLSQMVEWLLYPTGPVECDWCGEDCSKCFFKYRHVSSAGVVTVDEDVMCVSCYKNGELGRRPGGAHPHH